MLELKKIASVTFECDGLFIEIHSDGAVYWGNDCVEYPAEELLNALETVCDELRKVAHGKETRPGHYIKWNGGRKDSVTGCVEWEDVDE